MSFRQLKALVKMSEKRPKVSSVHLILNKVKSGSAKVDFLITENPFNSF